MTRLDITELGQHLGRYQRSLFRMETLPAYAVTSDGDDYNRWLAGETEPTWERKNRWLDVLRAERAAGKDSRRVRVLTPELTDYERYSCEWGYALNALAGEDIRVLHRGEHPLPEGHDLGDFWIVDNGEAVLMRYDEHGRFLHADVIPDAPGSGFMDYLWRAGEMWDAAEPFLEWWARHPELHRQVAA